MQESQVTPSPKADSTVKDAFSRLLAWKLGEKNQAV